MTTKTIRAKIRRFLPVMMIGLLLGGPVIMTACQQRVCPANNRQQFNRKRARYSRINHLKKRGGKGQKHKRTKRHRRPKYKFFKTRFKRSQFKHQTK